MSQVINPQDRIFVTGHRGLVGSQMFLRLQSAGLTRVLTATRKELDLCGMVMPLIAGLPKRQPDYVIHAAGKVGGIGANIAEPVDFCYDNLLIQATVLRAAWQSGSQEAALSG